MSPPFSGLMLAHQTNSTELNARLPTHDRSEKPNKSVHDYASENLVVMVMWKKLVEMSSSMHDSQKCSEFGVIMSPLALVLEKTHYFNSSHSV